MTLSKAKSGKTPFSHDLLEKLRELRRQTDGDNAELARQIQTLGISVPHEHFQWLVAELLRGSVLHGEHFVPTSLLGVVRGLLEGTKATLAIDPWAGVGVLATAVKHASHATHVIAYATSPGHFALAKVLAPELDWRLAAITDPLRCLGDVPNHIDVAACIPPMGMKALQLIAVAGPDGSHVTTRDVGQALLAACALKLSAQGTALFVLPAAAFFSNASILRQLPQLGLGLEAALELPSGSFAPYANVSAYLCVVRKARLALTFVAQLSQDGHTNHQILTNLRERRADGAIEMGRLIAVEHFRGFRALRLADRLRQAEARIGTPAVPLGELSASITLGRPATTFEFPSIDNAIFVPLVGISEVVTSTDVMTLKPQNYAQLAIQPTRSDARFVARFLNSELGQEIRAANMSGSTILKLNSTGLRELRVFVPPLDTQERVLDLTARIGKEANTVLSLQTELSGLTRDLWANPTQLAAIDTRLRDFSRKLQSGATAHATAAVEQWFESLPFPLASILRAWQATSSHDYKTKLEHLLHFFEGTAEFLSVIYLSAFGSQPELFAEHKQKLKEVWNSQHLTLERATFGTWKVVVEYCAKQTRKLIAGDTESRSLCKELFADESLALPEMLASKALPTICSTANKFRNDWSGHGGVVSQTEASLRNELLVTELHKLRDVMSDVWTRVQLVQARSCRPRRGAFETEVAVMMGSNSEFLKDWRSMSTWLDVERLYLVSNDSGRALGLLPLVHVGPSPASARNACYFFNRMESDGVRFVSYHFVDEPERHEQFADAAEAIRFLS